MDDETKDERPLKIPPDHIRVPTFQRGNQYWTPPGPTNFATIEFTRLINEEGSRVIYVCACQKWSTGSVPIGPADLPHWIIRQIKHHVKDEHL
jgi:hypothetical protein